MIVGSSVAFFFLLNIGIGFLLFLVFRSAADRIEFVAALFRAELSRGRRRRLADRLEYLRFLFFCPSTLHGVESITDANAEYAANRGQ